MNVYRLLDRYDLLYILHNQYSSMQQALSGDTRTSNLLCTKRWQPAILRRRNTERWTPARLIAISDEKKYHLLPIHYARPVGE